MTKEQFRVALLSASTLGWNDLFFNKLNKAMTKKFNF